jgi:hypothetical protein
VNSHEIILEFSAEILYVLLPLKMGKELVKKKQSRFSPRDRTAYTGQVMQLPECAGKGRFTALVRAGYDKDALAILQVKVVGHDGGLFRNEVIG